MSLLDSRMSIGRHLAARPDRHWRARLVTGLLPPWVLVGCGPGDVLVKEMTRDTAPPIGPGGLDRYKLYLLRPQRLRPELLHP